MNAMADISKKPFEKSSLERYRALSKKSASRASFGLVAMSLAACGGSETVVATSTDTADSTTTVVTGATEPLSLIVNGGVLTLEGAGSTVTVTGSGDTKTFASVGGAAGDGSASTSLGLTSITVPTGTVMTLDDLAVNGLEIDSAGELIITANDTTDSTFTLDTTAKVTVATGLGTDVVTLPNVIASGSKIDLGGGTDTLKLTAGGEYNLTLLDSSEDALLTEGGVDQLLVKHTSLAVDDATFTGQAIAINTIGAVNLDIKVVMAGASVDLSSVSGTAFTGGTALGASDKFTVTGTTGNDTITGSLLDDVLNGGAGNDTITGGIGADTINGGDNTDTVSYADISDAAAAQHGIGDSVIKGIAANFTGSAIAGSTMATALGTTVYLGGNATAGAHNTTSLAATKVGYLVGANTAALNVQDTVTNVEKIVGSDRADYIAVGTTMEVDAAKGNDYVLDITGINTIDLGAGDDVLEYTADGDLITSNAVVDDLDGGIGTDVIRMTDAGGITIASQDLDGRIVGFETFDLGLSAKDFTGGISITLHPDDITSGLNKIDLSKDNSEDTSTVDLALITDGDTDITTGGFEIIAGADNTTIKGTANSDVITSGTNQDSITLGAGNDTLKFAVADTAALAADVDVVTDFEVGTNLIDFTNLTNADLRGTGVGFETVAKGINAVAANTGIVLQNGDEADLLVATALTAANTMTGWSISDIVYFIATTGTDSALYRMVESSGDTQLDSAVLVATFTGVDETHFLAANFVDFA